MADEDYGIVRDPETGQIISKTLSSEQARRMAQKKHAKSVSQKEADTLALIQEAGYDDLETCPTDLRILAQQISESGARTVQALIEYRRRTNPFTTGSVAKPAPGEHCPTCGRLNTYGMRLDDDLLDALIQRLAESRLVSFETTEFVGLKAGRPIE